MSKLICRFVFFFSMTTVIFASFLYANQTLPPVTLTIENSGSTVTLQPEQLLYVRLDDASVDGGYIWEVVSGAESILWHSFSQFIPYSAAVGSRGTYTFGFKATAAGYAPLKLILHRVWEKGVAPLRTFEVTIIVGATPVPTMSKWGMLVFALLAGLSSVYALLRRASSQR